MPRTKLGKMLLESREAESQDNTYGITKVGVEQISDLSSFLKIRIRQWRSNITDYDPLFEIAKIAFLTDKEDLSFRCHQELAKYQYPQIRSLEIQAKEDKEIKISIHLADYAQSQPVSADIEDIEAEDVDDDEEHQEAGKDYTDYVLKRSDKSESGDGE